MYNKYFEEYYVSEEELKVKICDIIGTLSKNYSDEFNANLLNIFNPQQDTPTFLQHLIDSISYIQDTKHNFEIVTEIEALRMCAIILDNLLYVKLLEPILLKIFHMRFAGQFIGFRYLIAIEIIENKLNEELKYEPRPLYEEIMNPQNPKRVDVYETLLAQEEIARVCNNEEVKDLFWDWVEEFETSVENYIKDGLPNLVGEMCARIFSEALAKNADLLDDSLEEKRTLTPKEKRDFIKSLSKISQYGTNFRLGIKHGGTRKREGFRWNEENRAKFYEMIESIPKITRKKNGKKESIHLWDYIYEQFDSRGRDAKEILKNEPGYESIPPDLLNEAFEKWERADENFRNVDKEDSPKMFLFRHALHLLDFPALHFNKSKNKYIPYKKLTMQKHYDSIKNLKNA